MKITKRQLQRIIREGLADDAYEAGYNDALRDRPHGSNPDMRDLDPKSYDHGFDKGTAECMDLQRPSGTRGFYEGVIKEEMTFNERFGLARTLRNAIMLHLESKGRHLQRVDSAKIDNLVLQLVDLSQPD